MNQKYLALLLLLVIIGGLIWGFRFAFPLIAPFLIGIVFALLIEPLVRSLEKIFRLNRTFAILTTLVILVIIVLVVLSLAIFMIYNEVQRWLPEVHLLTNGLNKMIETVTNWFDHFLPGFKIVFFNNVSLNNSINQILNTLLINVIDYISGLPQLLISILFGAITAFFYSRDQNRFKKYLLKIVPIQLHDYLKHINEEIIENLAKFIRVEVALVFLTACFTWITFRLIGIDNAFTYGFLAGVFDIIPIMGPGLIFIPVAVISAFLQNYSIAILIICSYFILIFVRQLVQLKIVGDCFNFHPLITLFVFYLGLKFFGIIGIVLEPVVLIILRGYYRIITAKLIYNNNLT